MFTGQMEDSYFPVPLKAMGSDMSVPRPRRGHGRDRPGAHQLRHRQPPGGLARVQDRSGRPHPSSTAPTTSIGSGHKHGDPVEKSLDLADCDGKFLDFLKGVDLYIGEGQYTREEYRTRVGWGHSIWEDTMEVVKEVRPKRFALYHHDPDHDDDWVDTQLIEAKRYLAERNVDDVTVLSSKEGLEIEIPRVGTASS